MNCDIIFGSYYLIENETYESGKRVKLARKVSDWYKQKEPKGGYPKVKVALYQGMFVLLYDNEKADPCLICTQGYIDFVE